jgi:hypothetical protein
VIQNDKEALGKITFFFHHWYDKNVSCGPALFCQEPAADFMQYGGRKAKRSLLFMQQSDSVRDVLTYTCTIANLSSNKKSKWHFLETMNI